MSAKLCMDAVPEQWEAARKHIEARAKDGLALFDSGVRAIIAGGAIRDHLLNRFADDLDIFLLGLTVEDTAKAFPELEITDYGRVKYGIIKVDQIECDIVISMRQTVQEVLDDFDLGLCMVAWDGQSLIIDKRFLRDANERTLHAYNTSEKTEKHVEKIRKRFVGYDFDVVTG